MAFSYGFFNAKGLDRTYTAENFCDYLGSIICDGILDTYGSNFSLTPGSGLSVVLGTGKAWLKGHYFISDAPYTIDLSAYLDQSLPRYVGIAIVLNTAESARDITIEVTPGAPAENPGLPSYPSDANKTRLLMYAVRMNPGASSLTERDWYDYRDDKNVCGYCQCILGRCKVSEVVYQSKLLQQLVQEEIRKLDEVQDRLKEIEESCETSGVMLTDAGQIGEHVYYAQYSNGNLRLYGIGETYSYDIINAGTKSPFRGSEAITSVSVGKGITKIGDQLFTATKNLKRVSIPDTVTEIGWTAFGQSNTFIGQTSGLESVTLPPNLRKIGNAAFGGNRIISVIVPETVEEVGSYCFSDCAELTEAAVLGKTIGEYMFTRCSKLKTLTVTKQLKLINFHPFTYCSSLETIYYDGTVTEWNAVEKRGDWAAKDVQGLAKTALSRIECADGYLRYNSETNEWEEVIE